jgi:hypothetical protein
MLATVEPGRQTSRETPGAGAHPVEGWSMVGQKVGGPSADQPSSAGPRRAEWEEWSVGRPPIYRGGRPSIPSALTRQIKTSQTLPRTTDHLGRPSPFLDRRVRCLSRASFLSRGEVSAFASPSRPLQIAGVACWPAAARPAEARARVRGIDKEETPGCLPAAAGPGPGAGAARNPEAGLCR